MSGPLHPNQITCAFITVYRGQLWIGDLEQNSDGEWTAWVPGSYGVGVFKTKSKSEAALRRRHQERPIEALFNFRGDSSASPH